MNFVENRIKIDGLCLTLTARFKNYASTVENVRHYIIFIKPTGLYNIE